MKTTNLTLILSLTALLMTQNVSAQKATMNFSREEPVKDGSRHKEFETQYTEDAEFIYTRTIKGNDLQTVVIAKTSKINGKNIWEKTLPVDAYDLKQHAFLSDLEKTSDGFILFVKKEDLKAKESFLSAQKLDENLNPIGSEIIFATSKNIDKGGNYFMYKVSRVNNHFLLLGEYSFVKDYINESYSFSVIDENLNQIWEAEAVLPKGKYFALKSSHLDKDDNLVAIFSVSTNGKKISDPKTEVEQMIYYYNSGERRFNSSTIQIGSSFKYFSNLSIKVDTELERVIMSGFYHRTKQSSGSEGVFISQFDLKEFEATPTKTYLFTEEIIENLIGTKDAKKGRLPENLYVKETIISPSGPLTFVIEEYTVEVPIQDNRNSNFQRSTNYYNDILLLNVNDEGVKWHKIIPKSSVGFENITNNLSFYVFTFNNIVYTVFNAYDISITNPEKTENKYFMMNSTDEDVKVVILGYDMNNGKEVEARNFSSGKNSKMICNIKGIKQLEPNKLGLSFFKSNKMGKTLAKIEATLSID